MRYLFNLKTMKKIISLLMLFFIFNNINAQCTFTDSSQVQIGSISKVDADCASNGSITINNVTGGGGTYAYEIISGPVIRIIQSQNTFAALPGGDYVIRVNGCNGTFIDSSITILDKYIPFRISRWRTYGLVKVSGLNCSNTTNGVYKVFKPVSNLNPGGKAPYKYQINTTNNFAAVPYTPSISDTAYFSNLNASTSYVVRVTDACNNAIVFTFTTDAATTSSVIAEPYLEITPNFDYACLNKGSLGIKIKNFNTGGDYLGADLPGNIAYWGTGSTPVLRLQIKNSSTNQIYLDNNLKVTSGYSNYYVETDYIFDGPTGLTALNSVSYTSWSVSYGNVLGSIKTQSNIPINTPLTVTIFFPGGNQCGTVIPASTKTYTVTIAGDNNPQPVITSVGSNCSWGDPKIIVTSNRGFRGNFYLMNIAPYSMIGFLIGTYGDNIFNPRMDNLIGGTPFSLGAANLEVGKTYRIILEDACGRKDSVDYIYNPSSSIAPVIPISDSTAAKLTCSYSNTDSLASIYIKKMPTGYELTRAYVNGIPTIGYGFTGILLADGQYGYVLNSKLPPGTYNYTAVYRNGCSTNSVTKSITIPPYPALQYLKSFTATVVNIPQSCGVDGKTYIQLNGYLKNLTSSNKLLAVRLISVPNNAVFPLYAGLDYGGQPNLSMLSSPAYFDDYIFIGDLDSTYLYPDGYRLFINPNQIGTYKFAVDVQCKDGSFVETLFATVNVSSAAPYSPSTPSLANANALMCDGGAVLNINTTATGGVGTLLYQYKEETSTTWIATASGGTSNSIVISPMPAAGTIYDIKVTDGCGTSATIKVVAQNFTGNFYIHSFFPNCANPSAITVRTSSVLGAIYTWRKNGVIIGNGTNLYQLDATIANGDNITVDVNIFNCYYKNASKVFNPNYEYYTWFGTDDNWFNAANWCPGVPLSSSNVKIPAGLTTYPIIPSGNALCKNILIENTASVKVTNVGRFNLYGVITNNGTLDLLDGTLVVKGTQAQTFSGAIFYKRTIKNIEIANTFSTNPVVSLSATLNDTLNITGNVSFGNVNSKEFKTNNNLTLKSTAAGTANVNDITNNENNTGNSIVDKVSVERYMFARSAWRLLATPIEIATSPTVSQAWRENNAAHTATGYGTRITGPVGTFGAAGTLDDYSVRPSNKSKVPLLVITPYKLKRPTFVTFTDAVFSIKIFLQRALPLGIIG